MKRFERISESKRKEIADFLCKHIKQFHIRILENGLNEYIVT